MFAKIEVWNLSSLVFLWIKMYESLLLMIKSNSFCSEFIDLLKIYPKIEWFEIHLSG